MRDEHRKRVKVTLVLDARWDGSKNDVTYKDLEEVVFSVFRDRSQQCPVDFLASKSKMETIPLDASGEEIKRKEAPLASFTTCGKCGRAAQSGKKHICKLGPI